MTSRILTRTTSRHRESSCVPYWILLASSRRAEHIGHGSENVHGPPDALTIRVETPQHDVRLEMELRDGGPEHSSVTLLEATTGGDTDVAEDVRHRFAIHVIEPLRARARARAPGR